MIYLPLLLVNELSFRVRDLLVGQVHTTRFTSSGKHWLVNEGTSCLCFIGDQQQHRSAPSDCVLRGNLFKGIQILGASTGRGLFPATVW